jgi:hypothetical protein
VPRSGRIPPPPPSNDPFTHYIGGLAGPRAGPEGYGKSRRYRDSIPGVSSPLLILLLLVVVVVVIYLFVLVS